MKIVFSGGGTLGPVTPLIAVIEELRVTAHDDTNTHEILWIGTERGVELPFLRKLGIEVVTIPSGKLRRYFTWKNFSDIRNSMRGFFAARRILKEFSPDVVVSAGGFVSVPVHYAAWSLGIKSVVHQQDVVIGLANKIMSWIATCITVSTEEHLKKFGGTRNRHVVYTGNPVRSSVLAGNRETAIELFHLQPDLATVFVFGGGTGADAINRVMDAVVRESGGQFQIIHLTGSERRVTPISDVPTYHPYPFFMGEMAHAYAVADVVVARAGFNTITEIAAWGKPTILIPMYRSHQEANAAWAMAHKAAHVVGEMELTSENLLREIREILSNEEKYTQFSDDARALFPDHACKRVTAEILGIKTRLAK